MPKFQSLKGFRDFYPEDFATRSFITDTWRFVARKHGFQEYDAPPLESLELYKHKSGEELVSQLYSFVDKGGREVAMRPEMTPSVARMIAERWQSLAKPVRWFSVPQLFRYERPQAGRLREHFQFNADIFGDASPRAEAELLAMVVDAFEAFSLTFEDVQVRLSDRRVLNGVLSRLGATPQQLPTLYSVLDKFEREDRDRSRQRLRHAGISDEQVRELFDLVETFRNVKSFAGLEAVLGEGDSFLAMLHDLSALIDDPWRWITFDLTIVRGLGYYTGTVFEAFDTRGKYRAICGGGRYDGLLESLGGPPAAAIGFGWGDVVLTELLRDLGKIPDPAPTVDWIVYMDQGPTHEAYPRVKRLRKMGFKVLGVPGPQGRKVQSQAKASNSTEFFYVIGERTTVVRSRTGEIVRHHSYDVFLNELEALIRTRQCIPTPDEIWTLAQSPHLRSTP